MTRIHSPIADNGQSERRLPRRCPERREENRRQLPSGHRHRPRSRMVPLPPRCSSRSNGPIPSPAISSISSISRPRTLWKPSPLEVPSSMNACMYGVSDTLHTLFFHKVLESIHVHRIHTYMHAYIQVKIDSFLHESYYLRTSFVRSAMLRNDLSSCEGSWSLRLQRRSLQRIIQPGPCGGLSAVLARQPPHSSVGVGRSWP